MSYVSPRVPSPSSRIPVPAASPRVQVPDSTASSGATVYAAPRPIPITPPTLTSIADAQDGVTLAVPSRPGVETDSAKLQRIKSWPQRALRDPVPRFPWLEGPPKKSSPLQSTSGPIGLEPEDTAASTRTRPADTLVENNQPTVHKAKPTSGARQRSRSDLLQSQRMPESSEEMTVDGINQRPQLFPLSHTRQASVPQKPTDLMPVSESEVPLKFDPMYSWLHEGPAVPFGAKHHGQRLGLIQRSGGEVEPIPITNTPSSEDEEISSTFPSTSISVSSHRATTSISASIGPSSHGSSPPPSSATLFDSLVPSPGPYGSFSSNTASSQAPCVDIMYANGGKPTEHWVQGRTAAEVHNWVTQPCPTHWKLRLIIGSRERSATSVAVLPFDDQTYDFIQREFDLPEDMLKAARDDHEFITHYFHHDLKSGTRRLCLLLRLMLFDKDGCCLALSYDSTTHSTYALLLGLLDRPRAPKEELAEQLRRSASSAWHPLFLPLLLLRNRSERIALKMQYSIGSGFDVELSQAVDKGVSAQPQSNQRSGRGHSSPGRSTPKSNDRDVEAVLTRLCTMSTDIGIVQTAAELLLASLRRIEDLRDAVVKQTSTKLLMLQADEDDDFLMNVQRTNDTVERHIDYIKNANSNRIIRVAQMKENVQRQLDGVETLITHRDNKTKLWAGLR